MKIQIFNLEANNATADNGAAFTFEFNPVFAVEKPSKQAIFDAIQAERSGRRQGTHKTKTRAEVSGGGRKPWRQKGTGRARHGSIRSPIWRGGGVNFGPTMQRNYAYGVNRKVHKLALNSALTLKLLENNTYVFDKSPFTTSKTADLIKTLKAAKIDLNKKILIITKDISKEINLASANYSSIGYQTLECLGVEDIVHHDLFIFDKAAIELLTNSTPEVAEQELATKPAKSKKAKVVKGASNE